MKMSVKKEVKFRVLQMSTELGLSLEEGRDISYKACKLYGKLHSSLRYKELKILTAIVMYLYMKLREKNISKADILEAIQLDESTLNPFLSSMRKYIDEKLNVAEASNDYLSYKRSGELGSLN